MIGIGRGIALNFQDLAGLLNAARHTGFAVRPITESTGRFEGIVKGFQSWAKALRLIEGDTLTTLAQVLLDLDPSLAQTLTRGVCYVGGYRMITCSNTTSEIYIIICEGFSSDVYSS